MSDEDLGSCLMGVRSLTKRSVRSRNPSGGKIEILYIQKITFHRPLNLHLPEGEALRPIILSKILFKDTSDNVEMKYAKKMLNAQELEDLAMDIEGDHGNYKLRFYDTDNDKSNYERMTLQKDGENEFFIDGITEIIGKIIGVDDDVELDNIYAIRLNSEIFSIVFNERKEASIYMVTDNEVVSVLLDAMRSPKFNNGNGAGYITVSRNESNLVLGDE